MARVFEVAVEIPTEVNPETKKPYKPGDTFVVHVEEPEKVKRQRGVLNGIELKDMTDEQLKREIINANSVLYKAKQRGAAEEILAANQARVDAAQAEKANRPSMAASAKSDAVVAAAVVKPAANVDETMAQEL